MDVTFIGRKKEKQVLLEAMQSREAEMVSVIGRRRTGKTFLIKTVLEEHFVFQLTGTQNAPMQEQLLNFAIAMKNAKNDNGDLEIPSDWMRAFYSLTSYLDTLPKDKKKVVFLDELPWLAANNASFIRGLSFFWNSWAVNQNIVVVICGSSASWMIQKIVNDKGGLHNRITKRIILKPFTLAETEEYLKSRNINLDRYHLVQIYMAMGGIPHYLKEIRSGKSATQIIDEVCFSETGLLRDEFPNLYSSLFYDSHNHIAIIRALAKTRQGLDRNTLIATAKVANGGTITKVLEELQQSGFIDGYYPFGKKTKDKLYRLTDEYSLFYLQFIESKRNTEPGFWQQMSQTQEYKTWCGYTFESLCLKHIFQIKKTMGIGGIYAPASSFLKRGNEEEKGFQIDLLIDRADKIINLFEIKFYDATFSLTKDYAQKLREKKFSFIQTTKTKRLVLYAMITTFGIEHNQHSLGLIEQNLTLDALFAD